MKFLHLLFNLFLICSALAQINLEIIPEADLEEISQLSTYLNLVTSVENPSQIVQVIYDENMTNSPFVAPICNDGNPMTNRERRQSRREHIVVKEKADIKFYFRVIGPVEDIRNTQMERVDPNVLTDDLKSVIQAQTDAQRDSAIASLCADKSNMEKINYGSALFGLLGNVYNYGLSGGGTDSYSSVDQTKDPNDVKKITIQRQYNVLNGYVFGESGYPPVAGVCRHASTLVGDFLKKCGFEMDQVQGLGYATDDFSGHAIVKVKDPDSGNTYTLNWGEMTQTEIPDYLSNYELPSNSIVAAGMIIQLYDASEEARYTGFTRNNRGTVVARLLGVDDEHFDVSTYTYNEPGMVIEKEKTKFYVNTGKTKEIMNQFIFKLADAQNTLPSGDKNTGSGAGFQYNRNAATTFQNGLILTKGLNLSVAGYTFNETMNLIMLDPSKSPKKLSIQGLGVSGTASVGLEKTIKNTTLFTQAALTGEGYINQIAENQNPSAGSFDGIYYATVKAGVNQKIDENTNLVIAAQTNVSLVPDVTWNEKAFHKNLNLSTDRNIVSAKIYRNVSENVNVSGGYEYAGSIEYRRHQANAMVEFQKQKISTGGSFTVVVDPASDNSQKMINIYVVKKININDKVDLNANFGVTQNLNTGYRFYNVGVAIPINR